MSRIDCTDCSRHTKCEGGIAAEISGTDLMVLGESPGVEEEAIGEPFKGRSGQLLRSILRHISTRCIIANCVCCFADAKPSPKQIAACRPRWVALVRKYKPKVLVALGGYAASAVLGHSVKMGADVGSTMRIDFGGAQAVEVPVVLQYHPAYILRMRGRKGGAAEKVEAAWLDTWQQVGEVLERGVAEPPATTVMDGFTEWEIADYLDHVVEDCDGLIAYDYETWGDVDALRPELNRDFRILCINVCTNEGAAAFPYERDGHFGRAALRRIGAAWKRVIALGKEGQTVAHNAKYEHKCNLVKWNVTAPLKDTMLRMNVLDERASGKLESVARWCGLTWSGYKMEMGDVRRDPRGADLAHLLRYGGLDALATFESGRVLTQGLEYEGIEDVAEAFEAYALALARVEIDGMAVDKSAIPKVRKRMLKEADEAKHIFLKHAAVGKTERWAAKNIKSWKAGGRFNPVSPKQMQHLCVEVLKLPLEQTSKGGYKCDKKALIRFEETEPVIRDLLRFRSIQAMFSGFLDKWDESLCPRGRVHTNYNQAVSVTGRLTSTNPNLQNIPLRSPVRSVFVSRFLRGRLVAGDFSQLEPRLLAGWSGDAGMIRAFADGLDLHLFVAAQIYEVEYEGLLAGHGAGEPEAIKMRIRGKAMNLGTMYGQTEHGLSEQTGMGLREAASLIARYNQRFPGVVRFREEQMRMAMRFGYVQDLFGRRRHLPAALSDEKWERERALRQASNAPIQSTGNQFCLISIGICQKMLAARKIEAVVVATDHDSIKLDVAEGARDEAIGALRDAMLYHNQQDYWRETGVPMRVDLTVGRNLFEMVPVA